jgi:hypothetical protein
MPESQYQGPRVGRIHPSLQASVPDLRSPSGTDARIDVAEDALSLHSFNEVFFYESLATAPAEPITSC